MLSPITSAANVRARGALSSAVGSGAATDDQISAAIELAQTKMFALVGTGTYAEVVGWGTTELAIEANATKKEIFDRAEAYLALAALPQIIGNTQLAQTGYLTKEKIGNNAEALFASQDEIDRRAKGWQSIGVQLLKPYLAVTLELSATNDNTEVDSLGVKSKDGRFFMMDT